MMRYLALSTLLATSCTSSYSVDPPDCQQTGRDNGCNGVESGYSDCASAASAYDAGQGWLQCCRDGVDEMAAECALGYSR